jgi:hypothetical protein
VLVVWVEQSSGDWRVIAGAVTLEHGKLHASAQPGQPEGYKKEGDNITQTTSSSQGYAPA